MALCAGFGHPFAEAAPARRLVLQDPLLKWRMNVKFPWQGVAFSLSVVTAINP